MAPALVAKTLLETSHSWNGATLHYPSGEAKVVSVFIEVAPGAETGWHVHSAPTLGYVLAGHLEVKLKNGRSKYVGPGDAFAEVVGTLHNGRNVGDEPLRLIVFHASAAGMPLTTMATEIDK